MKLVKSILLFYTINIYLFSSTPIEYSIHFDSGYDSNVMRFSKKEISEVSRDMQIIGGADTFDSFIYKIGIEGKKSIWNSNSKSSQQSRQKQKTVFSG